MEEQIPQTKKEISEYIHHLMNIGEVEKAEVFLVQRLKAGERTTIILGSLINLYKRQGNKWREMEELAKEYLEMKPNNSFAQGALELSQKMQRKRKKEDTNNIHRQNIADFRKKIYDGTFLLENLSDKLFTGFTEFEKTILLAEIYSHFNLDNRAIELLKQATKTEGITHKRKKIVTQALQLAKAKKMQPIRKKLEWGQLIGDEGRAEWEI